MRRSSPFRCLQGFLALLLAGVAACGDDPPVGPGTQRFGQVGRIRVELSVPLQLGEGELRQTLTWSSTGPWELTESIAYRELAGDDDSRQSVRIPDVLAGSYATWIAQVNEVPSLSLFIDALEPDGTGPPVTCVDPQRFVFRSRLTVTIRDAGRGEEMSWTRCVNGRLESLTTSGAGPDAAAARVAAAAILARDYALGEGFQSAYAASVPFGTVDRGEDSGAEPSSSFILTRQDEWQAFWRAHRGPGETAPTVDFGKDMVIVAAVGLRLEAGDSVEVRKVLPVGDGTFVQRVERVPGDFCSPAEKRHYPFHVVVLPIVPRPVRFVEPVAVERVPCGG